MAAEKQQVARQHHVCSMCPCQCYRNDASALPYSSQRAHRLPSQEMTPPSGPTYFLAVSTKLPACGNSWQPPHRLAGQLWFCCVRDVSLSKSVAAFTGRVMGPYRIVWRIISVCVRVCSLGNTVERARGRPFERLCFSDVFQQTCGTSRNMCSTLYIGS